MLPFAPGSVSLRIYPHNDLDPPAIVDELCGQAALAAAHGFDGVMTSEHHGGFAGYLPNPLQAAGWMLESMPSGWAAPCPLLLPLRPPALVAEEVAWLAARFPGRVGLGVAAGALDADFEVMDTDKSGLTARFADGLARVTDLLRGNATGVLAADRALAACKRHPVPVVSAVMGFTAARRAAACRAGLIFDSLSTPDRCAALIAAYREAGGSEPCILIRRAWVGGPPQQEFDRQVDVYRGYAGGAAQGHWGGDELITALRPDDVAARLGEVWRRTGADAVNLRVHAPGISPEAVREQIVRLGDEVLPLVDRAG